MRLFHSELTKPELHLQKSGCRVGVCSRGIQSSVPLSRFLGFENATFKLAATPRTDIDIFIGWGRRPSGERAVRLARESGTPFLLLEDGFLRSWGLGVEGAPPLSIVVDDVGIYYDATAPSRLEKLLQAGGFSPELIREAEKLLAFMRGEGLSKYNNGRMALPAWLTRPSDGERILVVDQTAADASIARGLADEGAFARMLESALNENPQAEICVKTHPDVLTGKKQGCLPPDPSLPRVRWIAGNWHPHALLPHFSKVYVVTSQMGLDALIAGREVHCFGMPFYAGWGLTRDRLSCKRRTARRTLAEIVAAAFLQYPRYILPQGKEMVTAMDAARHLARQKHVENFWEGLRGEEWSGRVICFGFRLWKQAQVRPFFGRKPKVVFVRSLAHARRIGLSSRDRIAVWGMRDPLDLEKEAGHLGLDIVRVEDGFIRSVGLGADFIPPMSLVFDDRGIYFDPSRPSRLEMILETAEFTREILGEARELAAFLRRNRITKYNTGAPRPLERLRVPHEKRVILVPGQVEDDASILRGAGEVRTNIDLLRAVRAANPDAYVIYKPHPDVMARNRSGAVRSGQLLAQGLCDRVETQADIISCLESADELHTMTSLSGFDALLRGLAVTCYGMPFYAGWGLTSDKMPIPRRGRRLTLDQLVAGALILYPRYMMPGERDFAAPMEVAKELLRRREEGRVSMNNQWKDKWWVRKGRKWRQLACSLARTFFGN